MRLLGATLGTLLVLLLVPSSGSALGTGVTTGECRQQWADLAQLHGENGNPGGSSSTRLLQQRWDSYDAEARRLASEATADCQGLEGFRVTWGGLERLMYGMQPEDYLFQLRIARGDLRHYREFNGRNPGPQVMRAFRFLRQQAPKAAGDLAPVVAIAPAVDTSEQAAVTAYLRDYRTAARASDNAAKAKKWLGIIGNAELHEE